MGSSVHHGNILAHNSVWLRSTWHNRWGGYEQQPPLASMVHKGGQEQDASCQADACCYPPGPLHHPGDRSWQCLARNWVAGQDVHVAAGCTQADATETMEHMVPIQIAGLHHLFGYWVKARWPQRHGHGTQLVHHAMACRHTLLSMHITVLLTSGKVVTAKYRFMPMRPDMALTSANATVTMVMTCRQVSARSRCARQAGHIALPFKRLLKGAGNS